MNVAYVMDLERARASGPLLNEGGDSRFPEERETITALVFMWRRVSFWLAAGSFKSGTD